MVQQTPTPPTLPEAPVGTQAPTTLSGLQALATELRIQLAGLNAQHDGLRSQLGQMQQSNPARPGVQQKWADVGVQIAQVRGDIARVEAQIAERTGVPGVPGLPPRAPNFPRSGRSTDPAIFLPIGAVLFLVMLLPLSVAWGKRIARGNMRPLSLGPREIERLERMEQAIDAVAIEVERVSEGQRFITKVLAERQQRAKSESAPQQASPEQPIRALGPGPAELLEIPEREPVRERAREQDSTPH